MSTVPVKTCGRPFTCVVGDPSRCRYCDAVIVWATTPRGKAISLEPWHGAGVTESANDMTRRLLEERSKLTREEGK